MDNKEFRFTRFSDGKICKSEGRNYYPFIIQMADDSYTCTFTDELDVLIKIDGIISVIFIAPRPIMRLRMMMKNPDTVEL